MSKSISSDGPIEITTAHMLREWDTDDVKSMMDHLEQLYFGSFHYADKNTEDLESAQLLFQEIKELYLVLHLSTKEISKEGKIPVLLLHSMSKENYKGFKPTGVRLHKEYSIKPYNL